MVSLDGILYNEGNYEKIQKKIGYLPQEIDLYPNLTVKECLVYMGGLSGVSRNDLEQRITYYLEKTSLTEHQNKKNAAIIWWYEETCRTHTGTS